MGRLWFKSPGERPVLRDAQETRDRGDREGSGEGMSCRLVSSTRVLVLYLLCHPLTLHSTPHYMLPVHSRGRAGKLNRHECVFRVVAVVGREGSFWPPESRDCGHIPNYPSPYVSCAYGASQAVSISRKARAGECLPHPLASGFGRKEQIEAGF